MKPFFGQSRSPGTQGYSPTCSKLERQLTLRRRRRLILTASIAGLVIVIGAKSAGQVAAAAHEWMEKITANLRPAPRALPPRTAAPREADAPWRIAAAAADRSPPSRVEAGEVTLEAGARHRVRICLLWRRRFFQSGRLSLLACRS
jgi:hypothetical protein